MQALKTLSYLGIAMCAATASVSGASSAVSLAVPDPVEEILGRYCYDCHDGTMSKGGVRLHAIAGLDEKVRLDLMNKLQEQIHFTSMPPEDEDQPDASERQVLMEWVRGELIKSNAPLIEDKLRYPDYGNAVDHKMLFSGVIKDKPFTPSRRWLVSPQIFSERIIDVFNIQDKDRENYKAKGFYGVTNPFVLPDNPGVRDYAITALDGGHLLVMLNNAKWIAEKQIRSARVKKGELKAKEFENPKDTWSPPSHPTFETIILNPSKPGDDDIIAAIHAQFDNVLRRQPDTTEQAKYLAMTRSAIELAGNTEGLRQMLTAVLLESEFLYRHEFGAGGKDSYGRRMLSPREASYAISYALGDRGPDPELVKAAESGRLNTREDYQREVMRLLADEKYYHGQIDHAVGSITSPHPKIIRFFREFFGYSNALKVFKDVNRSDGYYGNPGRGSSGTGGTLIREADMIVEMHLKQDKRVFENMLGSELFFVAHMGTEPELKNLKRPPVTVGEKVDALNKIYDLLEDTDWRKNPKKVAEENPEVVRLIRRYLLWNGDEDKFKQIMTHVEVFRKQGLNPNPHWSYPFSMGKMIPWVRSYSINPMTWEFAQQQPFKLENRKGILTHPAWLIAHSSNFHTDIIRRGRWIHEKLLAGRVPDVPITVDAKVPEDPHKTFRDRVESVTEEKACWKCHQHMNPLGYAFEMYDDFGRFRTEESLENPENLIAKAKGKYNADTYKTKPVNTTGALRGTGDPRLDGSVQNAIDLIKRLEKSDRVRQSIIRHAFRYYMGRNEMLSDSQTLIAADKAYLHSGGSFKAVIVSLLTSDSFMYRK